MEKICTITDLSSFYTFNPTHSWIYYFPQCTFSCKVLQGNCQTVIKHVYINIWRVFFSLLWNITLGKLDQNAYKKMSQSRQLFTRT